MPGELERLGVYDIDICRGNGKNDAVWLRNVLRDKVPCLFLDIGGLVADGNLDERRRR